MVAQGAEEDGDIGFKSKRRAVVGNRWAPGRRGLFSVVAAGPQLPGWLSSLNQDGPTVCFCTAHELRTIFNCV